MLNYTPVFSSVYWKLRQTFFLLSLGLIHTSITFHIPVRAVRSFCVAKFPHSVISYSVNSISNLSPGLSSQCQFHLLVSCRSFLVYGVFPLFLYFHCFSSYYRVIVLLLIINLVCIYAYEIRYHFMVCEYLYTFIFVLH